MATQPFYSNVYVKGLLTVGDDLKKKAIKATLHLQQAQHTQKEGTKELARFGQDGGGGLKIDQNKAGGLIQALTGITAEYGTAESAGTEECGVLALNPEGGTLELGAQDTIINVQGNLAVRGATHFDGDLCLAQKLFVRHNGQETEIDLLKQPLSEGKLAGPLTVGDELLILNDTNPLKFTSSYTKFADSESPNRAEISNDNKQFKTLMIVGNKSQGIAITKGDGKKHTMRRVSVWDRLEVNGPEPRTGQLVVDGDLTVTGKVFKQLADGETASFACLQVIEEGDVRVTVHPFIIHTTDLNLDFTEVMLQKANVSVPTLVTCRITDGNLPADAAISWDLCILGAKHEEYALRIYCTTKATILGAGISANVHYRVYQLTDP